MIAYELYELVEAQERKYARMAAIFTLLLLLTGGVGVLIYDLVRDDLPPPGMEEYEVLGSIDFGNYTPGSRQVNNFQPPVENPVEEQQEVQETVEQPQPQPEAAQPDPAPPAETAPTPAPQVTTTQPAEVKAPDPEVTKPDPTPSPPATTTPKPTTTPTTNNNSSNTTTTQPAATTPTTSPSSSTSGSNHGDEASGTGNAGTPDVKTLDPNGLYSFGSGSGGLKGRGVLKLGDPAYSAQEEGVLEFKFRIEPDGTVSYATTTGPTTKLALKAAGIAAIKKWRFTALRGAQPQFVTVKITFRLKG
ncbi:MAG: energy transducer TonB [Bacteroidia bacterium]